MQVVENRDHLAFSVYQSLKNSLVKYNRSVSLPMNNCNKTYSWRYINNFIDKMDELGINSDNYNNVIEALTRHARKRNLLSRGFSILSNKSLIEIVIKQLENEETANIIIKREIRKSHEFIINNCSNKLEFLLTRKSQKAYTNMTLLYEKKFISEYYICASKVCLRILKTMSESERARYPSSVKLLQLFDDLSNDKDITAVMKEMLGDDIRKSW